MMKNILQVSGNMVTISVFNVNYPRPPFSSMYDKFTCIHVHYVYDYLFSSMQTVEQILEMLLVYINCCFNEQIVFKSKWYLKIVLTWKLCNVTTFYEHKMYPQGRQLLHIKISKKSWIVIFPLKTPYTCISELIMENILHTQDLLTVNTCTHYTRLLYHMLLVINCII